MFATAKSQKSHRKLHASCSVVQCMRTHLLIVLVLTFISIHILDLITFYIFAHYSFLHFSPFSRMIFLSPKIHTFRISTKKCFLVVNITCEMHFALVFGRKFCRYRVLGWQLLSHGTFPRSFPMISTGFQMPERRFRPPTSNNR